ncbi:MULTISPECIES: zinc-dependent alcohol dehydrogenase family protein [Chryseobacterium]|uniref:NADPH2:quinone reductase n=1 Tax=Chryseobacterium camelliae TaxID=1265445 RepID=A0ABU0TJE3_9FLAO|nr:MULTISPECIES: zinc-dependent alcohol dehydrogenase family protein [Chryseobacterium]MDT3409208.1 NADPH2:quinone reductase [Pseudacidovorax intermedius]MDQ1096931.1 NADPH2:quinone reductase [Chryseobacterium camelliae]MDQ1100873.1 NADPH2:quinone reductase [Chryseobacterium sp. SORGH_AS_1048]MDR6084315.1 NADPH2:quinone reductase [Chryseobacterium sp. SORGH_AS_0909]MDR6132586.1 NADPH2:quinone reductase [Chryseobacterium sp. SORGH_AS_1175]
MMEAIVVNCFGKPENTFQAIRLPIPHINDDEVLIKVKATSVNPIDYKIRSGDLPHLVPSFPAILHGDVSGIVEKTGTNVRKFQAGDYVYGCIGGVVGINGALAEYTTADYRLLSKMPNGMSFTEAAAVPLVGITAYEAIFQRAKIVPGQKVLIYGGVGGVGHLALQFAKFLGAKVYATISNDQQDGIAKKLGADYTIDYRKETVEDFVNKHTEGKGFDMVFDTIGNQHLANSFEAVKRKGTVITTVSLDKIDLSLIHEKALTLHTVYMIIPILYNDEDGKKEHGAILRHITELMEQGKVMPLIDPVSFTLHEIAQAHIYAESGKSTGKIVIRV